MPQRLTDAGLVALLALAALFAGTSVTVLLADDAAPPVPEPLPCASIARYAADLSTVLGVGSRRLGGRLTSWFGEPLGAEEIAAAQQALAACIEAHGLTRAASPDR